MRDFVNEYIRQLHTDHKKHRRLTTITSLLSLVVMLSVVWGLHSKGISLANDMDCGIDEHEHTEVCYKYALICGHREGEIVDNMQHEHTDECYEQILQCEIDEHIHTVECVNVDPETEIATDEEVAAIGEPETLSENEIEALNEDEEIGADTVPMIDISPDAGMLSTSEMIQKAYQDHLDEMAKDPSERDNTKLIKFGEFYVVTATGLRYKHKINEYLWPAHESGKDPDGVNRKYIDEDGEYMQNGSWYKLRYQTYEGYPLQLVVFRDPDDPDQNYQDDSHQGSFIYAKSDGTEGRTTGARGTGEADDYQGVEWLPGGGSAVYTYVDCGERDTNAVFTYQRPGKTGDEVYENFYAYVRDPEDPQWNYTHSDIEITDGGFFKVSTQRDFTDGSEGYQRITTKYNSFVSAVNMCKLYFYPESGRDSLVFPGIGVDDPSKIKDPVARSEVIADNALCGLDKTVYQKNNEQGDTQYELTSQFICAYRTRYHYKIQDVKNVIFTIELSLAPTTSLVEKLDKDGNVISSYTKDFANKDGSYNYFVTPLRVNMGTQSIVDAMNKCPNHTGMDFNLLYSEVNLNLIQPDLAQWSIQKDVDGEGMDPRDYTFILENVVTGDKEEFTPGEDGKLDFPEQLYPFPGQFRYKIYEKIPDDAVEILPHQYYKEPYLYDGRVIDVNVDVEVSPEYLAVVEQATTDAPISEAVLNAQVSYSINGKELTLPDDEEQFVFLNRTIHHDDYKTTTLHVNKVWGGSAKTNHPDNVTFRIIRTKNGSEKSYYNNEDGLSVFELSELNSWTQTFTDLPTKIGSDTYTYKIEETELFEVKDNGELLYYAPQYTRVDNADGSISWTITNTLDSEKTLYVKKVWKAEDGTILTGPRDEFVDRDGNEEVHLKLYREYMEREIPVKIMIRPDGGASAYSQEVILKGYKGEDLEFRVSSPLNDSENLAIERILPNTSSTPAEDLVGCVYDSATKTYKVTNIQNGTQIVLNYPRETELLAHYTKNTEFNTPTFEYVNGSFQDLWKSCYTDNSDAGIKSVGINKRTSENGYIALNLDPAVYKPGQSYSFSSYMTYTSNPAKKIQALKMQLKTHGTYGNQIETIATVENPDHIGSVGYLSNWYLLQNVNVKIPDGTDQIQLLFATDEAPDSPLVDIYLDDVMISKAGYNAQILSSKTKGVGGITDDDATLAIVRNFEVEEISETIPNNVKNGVWTPEGIVKSFGVSRAISTEGISWFKTIKMTEMDDGKGEVPNRKYQYYVDEPLSDNPGISKYIVKYIDDYVATNDPSNPIIVENKYSNYVLPRTGGVGVHRIRMLGLLIFTSGFVLSLWMLRRKRGKPSG